MITNDHTSPKQTSNKPGTPDLSPASIKWTPLTGGGINFRTHTLVKVNELKMEFHPSLISKLFCGAFIVFGLFLPIYHHAAEDIVASSSGPFTESLMAIGIGGALIWIGLKIWRLVAGKFTFDKDTGRFINIGIDYRVVSLDEVCAIQLMLEQVKSSEDHVGSIRQKTSFTSYELNLVLCDGKRVPVIDHSGRHKIRQDVEKLGKFLGVPV